ncbi:MAG TPA: DMT family transporter [Pararhizobium sp.]|nr:DMT family transporter [Pararhizobium sp.]
MPNRLPHPYMVLSFVALIWGANAVAGKLAVGHISPMILTLMRWIFAVSVLAPFSIAHVRRDWPLIRAHLPLLAGLGVFGFSVFNALFYLSLYYTSTLNVLIEQSAMPLFVFTLSFLLFRTRVTLFQFLGFAITAAGVAVTAAHGDLSTLLDLDLNRGDALMLVAVVLYASFTVALRYKPAIHWLSLIFILSSAALVCSIPLAILEIRANAATVPDLQGLGIALFTAIFPSIIAQSLYIRGVEMIGPNRANIFINLTPIFGAILAILIVGERLFAYHVVALALVLLGIMLAERRIGAAAST